MWQMTYGRFVSRIVRSSYGTGLRTAYTPPMRSAWSIRWWLGGLVAAVGVPLLLLAVWLYAAQAKREQQEAREAALRIAKATAARMATLHADSFALLDRMAARP